MGTRPGETNCTNMEASQGGYAVRAFSHSRAARAARGRRTDRLTDTAGEDERPALRAPFFGMGRLLRDTNTGTYRQVDGGFA